MKLRFRDMDGARRALPQRGAAPVGHLRELPPLEMTAVFYFRAWCAGLPDRGYIARDFRLVMGEIAGDEAADEFDALMTVLTRHARRPIMHHALDCGCLGGDESAFANMIAAAAVGDCDDALLFAAALTRGDAAYPVVRMAQRMGRAFLRVARVADHLPRPDVTGKPIHRH
ncbi:hypothetical protein LV82_01525 [Albidovulum inexpectatum]|uniref:Uncharacterized protein n=1 Tax=Albidovulum inexpectatum TaxID=196587 RepID=A0A2S5JH38_9RHOB|nr:hypothetical protein [Albidovulum inexpectatum]PPB80793.1 hypothetical protein LV82_01525 [Albidovulum inexpectatum]